MTTDLEHAGIDAPAPGVWRMHFSWARNPLPMNGPRGTHWAPRARMVRTVRQLVCYRALQLRIPHLGRCSAQLIQWVADRRVRDVDNLAALEKPLFDGLVSAEVVQDDAPAFMDKLRGDIRHIADHPDAPVTRPGWVFTITAADRRVDVAS